MRSLDAAPRCLLARLLYLKEPWHACARLTSYVQEVRGAVAALEHAGALLTYQAETTSREQTLELLPCLTVQHELRAIRAAVKSAAAALAKAGGGKQPTIGGGGGGKPAILASIQGLARTWAAP